MVVKIIKKKGNRVVLIKRGRIQIAPTYGEIRDCIIQLSKIYGIVEVLRAIGLWELIQELTLEMNRAGVLATFNHIRKEKHTFYKGIAIKFDEDEDKRVFWALDEIEKKYPDIFKATLMAGESEGTLFLWAPGYEERELTGMIDVRLPGSEYGDSWSVLFVRSPDEVV